MSDQTASGFIELGIRPTIAAVLARTGITAPTPIQQGAIPRALAGQDIVGIAQTGTGKTLAFALPIIQAMVDGDGSALILVPTRELALQVEESILRVARALQPVLRTISLIGGTPVYRQIRDLKSRPRIIIATPGRLNDLLQQRALSLSTVRFLVLDEADRMFDMGFAPQVATILACVPAERQTLLFSATMSPEVADLASRCQKNPERIAVAPAGTSAEKIQQELCYVQHGNKPAILQTLLTTHSGTALVFSRTKHGATRLREQIESMGHSAAEIHANRSLGQRRQALDGFKAGHYRVLVATDIAARGIDVKDIALVVNYDLPDAAEDYIHRIGRTGRAGKSGKAISLATPDQRQNVRAIERLVGRPIPLSEHSLELSLPTREAPRQRSGMGNGSRQFFGPRVGSATRPPQRRRPFPARAQSRSF